MTIIYTVHFDRTVFIRLVEMERISGEIQQYCLRTKRAHQKKIFFFFAAVTELAQAEKCTICVPGGGYFIVACKLQYLGNCLSPWAAQAFHC